MHDTNSLTAIAFQFTRNKRKLNWHIIGYKSAPHRLV